MAGQKFNFAADTFDNGKRTEENIGLYGSRDESVELHNDASLIDGEAALKKSREEALREEMVAQTIALREQELREKIEAELREKLGAEIRAETEKAAHEQAEREKETKAQSELEKTLQAILAKKEEEQEAKDQAAQKINIKKDLSDIFAEVEEAKKAQKLKSDEQQKKAGLKPKGNGKNSAVSKKRPRAKAASSRKGSRTRKSYRYVNTELIAKVFCIIIPLLALFIGQTVQYLRYFKSDSVLLLDIVFKRIPFGVLIASTGLTILEIVAVIVRTWKMADEGDEEEAWAYFIIASLLFGAIPSTVSFFGIIAIPLTNYCISQYEEVGIGFAVAVISFIIGQVLTWVTYKRTGQILILSDLVANSGIKFHVLAYSIISSIMLAIAGLILIGTSGEVCEMRSALITFIPFVAFSCVLPALVGIPLLVYSIIFATVTRNAIDEDRAAMITSIVSFSVITVAVIVLWLMTKEIIPSIPKIG